MSTSTVTIQPQCSIVTCFCNNATKDCIKQSYPVSVPVIGFDSCMCFFLCLCVVIVPQVELKFPAPSKTGNYQYSVILRSDSYMGLDQIKPLKVTRRLCVHAYVCDCLEDARHRPKGLAEQRQYTHGPRPKRTSSLLNNGVHCCQVVRNKWICYKPNRA